MVTLNETSETEAQEILKEAQEYRDMVVRKLYLADSKKDKEAIENYKSQFDYYISLLGQHWCQNRKYMREETNEKLAVERALLSILRIHCKNKLGTT